MSNSKSGVDEEYKLPNNLLYSSNNLKTLLLNAFVLSTFVRHKVNLLSSSSVLLFFCHLKQGCRSSRILFASAFIFSLSVMLPSLLPLSHSWDFLLPLPAPDKVGRFRVHFRFQLILSKRFRFLRFLSNYIYSLLSTKLKT